MASSSRDDVTITVKSEGDELEPGACPESVLNPTDTFEDFASEMTSGLHDDNKLSAKTSTISEIQSEIGESSKDLKSAKSTDDLQSKDVSGVFLFL